MKRFLTNEVEEHSHHEKKKPQKNKHTKANLSVEMGIENNLGILILLSILAGSSLMLRIITKQHIKDIFVQINCILCGQMFVHIGGIFLISLLCTHPHIRVKKSYVFNGRNPHTQPCSLTHKCIFLINVPKFKGKYTGSPTV